MISDLLVPLKSVSSQNLKHVSEAQREQKVLSAHTCSTKHLIGEPDPVPPHFTHSACPLLREVSAAGPFHCPGTPMTLAVLEEPKLLSLAPHVLPGLV